MVQWGGFDQSGLIKGFALKSEQATMFLRANLFQSKHAFQELFISKTARLTF